MTRYCESDRPRQAGEVRVGEREECKNDHSERGKVSIRYSEDAEDEQRGGGVARSSGHRNKEHRLYRVSRPRNGCLMGTRRNCRNNLRERALARRKHVPSHCQEHNGREAQRENEVERVQYPL